MVNGDATLSRRRFLRRTAIAGLGLTSVALLAACGGAAPPAPSASTSVAPAGASSAAATGATKVTSAASSAPAVPIKRGGKLVQAQAWTYPTFDLHLSSVAISAGYGMLFNQLLQYRLVDEKAGKFELKPELAESWEQPDPKSWVFKLRKGVKFHDGSDFNAEVAKWNLERLKKHEKSFAKTQLAALDSVDAMDSHTIKVNLSAPQPQFPFFVSGAAWFVTGIQSKLAVEKLGEAEYAKNPVGTGPMKFKQWIVDDRLIMERFPDYWESGEDGKPLPYIDVMESRYIPDLTVAAAELQSGSLMAAENMPANQIATLKANPSLQYVEFPWAPATYFILGFNAYAPPFEKLAVRQAALHAIDHEGMARALGFGMGQVTHAPYWNKSLVGYDEGAPKYEYSLDKAKALLAEAGYPKGLDITLKVILREPEKTIGEFAVAMWAKAGINTKLETKERLSWIDDVKKMQFQACFWRDPNPAAIPEQLAVLLKSGAPANWAGFKDDVIDAGMKEGSETSDPAKRAEIFKKVMRRQQEQGYLGAGYQLPPNYVTTKAVRGLTVQWQDPDFRRVWLAG